MKKFVVVLLLAMTVSGLNALDIKSDGFVPEYAADQATAFRDQFLDKNQGAADITFEFTYIGDNAVLNGNVVPKPGNQWVNATVYERTWAGRNGTIGLDSVKYKQSVKNIDLVASRLNERRKDPAFSDIEKTFFQLATDIDFDYWGAYTIRVKYRDPNQRIAFAAGYAQAVFDAFTSSPLVDSVEIWGGGDNHAWNVINLKDGRKLYADLTWYDCNTLDKEGFVEHVPDRNGAYLTFDIDEFNSCGFAIDNATGKLVAHHFALENAKKLK
jgi:hypothetical protein